MDSEWSFLRDRRQHESDVSHFFGFPKPCLTGKDSEGDKSRGEGVLPGSAQEGKSWWGVGSQAPSTSEQTLGHIIQPRSWKSGRAPTLWTQILLFAK